MSNMTARFENAAGKHFGLSLHRRDILLRLACIIAWKWPFVSLRQIFLCTWIHYGFGVYPCIKSNPQVLKCIWGKCENLWLVLFSWELTIKQREKCFNGIHTESKHLWTSELAIEAWGRSSACPDRSPSDHMVSLLIFQDSHVINFTAFIYRNCHKILLIMCCSYKWKVKIFIREKKLIRIVMMKIVWIYVP